MTTTTPACCPPGSWSQAILQSREELNKKAVSPAGSVVKVKNVDVYVTTATTTTLKGSIIVLQDIYSTRVFHPSARSGDRLWAICDTLAATGYNVAMPSLFGDKPFDLVVNGPDDGDFEKFNSFAQDGGVAWFKSMSYDKVGPPVKVAHDYLKEQSDDKLPVGVVGFCFGTWLLSKSSADLNFKCAVGCHPATTLESAVFGGDEIAMLNALRQPTLFLWAGNDSDIFVKDGEGKKALEKSGGGVEEYPDMLHGWVCRGDMSDEKVKRDVEKALTSMTSFFEKNMK